TCALPISHRSGDAGGPPDGSVPGAFPAQQNAGGELRGQVVAPQRGDERIVGGGDHRNRWHAVLAQLRQRLLRHRPQRAPGQPLHGQPPKTGNRLTQSPAISVNRCGGTRSVVSLQLVTRSPSNSGGFTPRWFTSGAINSATPVPSPCRAALRASVSAGQLFRSRRPASTARTTCPACTWAP